MPRVDAFYKVYRLGLLRQSRYKKFKINGVFGLNNVDEYLPPPPPHREGIYTFSVYGKIYSCCVIIQT